MVDVTDKHFRYLMRLISRRTVLWTDMYVARRLATRNHRIVKEMIRYHPSELPVVAQLGGDDPAMIVTAGKKLERAGYSEINLNLGCPARNAQTGDYGAMLMLPPHDNVISCAKAMSSELNIPVSMKLRIGVNDFDSYSFFRDFVHKLHVDGGINRFIIHSRKALLDQKVTTRQNRLENLVPLKYDYAYRLKQEFPHLYIEINGGIKCIDDIQTHMSTGMDGAMLGRLARDDPFFFSQIDPIVFGMKDRFANLTPLGARIKVLQEYAEYVLQEEQQHNVSKELLLRPMNKIFEGLPEKELFARLLRRKDKSPLLGDRIFQALDDLPALCTTGSTLQSTSKRNKEKNKKGGGLQTRLQKWSFVAPGG